MESGPESAAQDAAMVLVVDDEDLVLKVMVEMLGFSGFRVLAASSAERALPILRERCQDISLLIVDVMMPGMNGVQLAKLARTVCPEVKILFVSAYVGKRELEGILEGMHVLRKPFSMRQLRETVRQILGR